MEDADVGGARWEILLHESSCTNFYKGAFGWSEVHEVGSNGQERRRYDAINPCLFVVNLLDGKAIRAQGEDTKDDFKERLSFSYKLRLSIRVLVNNHHDIDRFSPRSS